MIDIAVHFIISSFSFSCPRLPTSMPGTRFEYTLLRYPSV